MIAKSIYLYILLFLFVFCFDCWFVVYLSYKIIVQLFCLAYTEDLDFVCIYL